MLILDAVCKAYVGEGEEGEDLKALKFNLCVARFFMPGPYGARRLIKVGLEGSKFANKASISPFAGARIYCR